MKWEQQTCPECGEHARYTAELVPAQAVLAYDPATDAFEWAGETEVCWNGQETVVDAEGREELWCANGHGWQTGRIPEPGGPYPYAGDVAARDAL